MKKTKITAALLAVSLGVTSFAAAPMTVTAENVTEAVSSAETKAEHTFEEIRNMSFDEMQTIFAERGMTFEKGYSLTHSLDGGFDFFIKPDAYMTSKMGKELVSVSTDRAELFDESDVVWDTQKIYSSLGLSPEMFDITPSASVVMREYNEQDVMVYSRFCECDILPVTRDREEFTSLYSALYNYIQLTPDFV